MINQVFRFTYTLSDDNNRVQSKSMFIIVVPVSSNPVQLSSPIYKINTDNDLQITAINPVVNNSLGYRWSYSSSGSSPVFLTPLEGSWVLSIQSGSLSPKNTYTFSLTYTDVFTDSTSIITIVTNSPPTSGTLSMYQTTGTALETVLIAQMIG